MKMTDKDHSDLYEMLKKRQDELRGREEDWIDRFMDWKRHTDWLGVATFVACVAYGICIIVAIMK